MSKPLFIATSDWHLDSHAWADRPEIAGDSLAAVSQIFTYAIKHQLPIMAAGDLLDRKINAAGLVARLRGLLDRLREAGVPLYFVEGQHELQADDNPWLEASHDWPVWLSAEAAGVELGGYTIRGIDWTPREELPAKLAEVPENTSVLLMHQVCHEFMGGITTAEMSFAQVPHARLLVVGDYHEHRRELYKGAQGQDLQVLSPGSTNMRKIDEPPDKKFFVVYDDLSFKSVRLATRPVVRQEVLSPEMLDMFVENIRAELKEITSLSKLPETLSKPLVWVRYRADVPDAYPRIKSAVGEWGHLFTKIITPKDDPEKIEGEETYEEVEELGLVGCLPLIVDETEEPEVFQLCRRLLESDAPQSALAKAREEFFAT